MSEDANLQATSAPTSGAEIPARPAESEVEKKATEEVSTVNGVEASESAPADDATAPVEGSYILQIALLQSRATY
jgi:hypothetical protein